jgi:hypothetical protein
MNPLTRLLAKLRRPATPSAPTPSPSGPTPTPVSPPAPLTEAERAVRAALREQQFLLRLAEDFGQAIEEDRDVSNLLPAELLRLVSQLHHNAADQKQARQWGHWDEELRLVTEAHELEAVAKFEFWQHALCEQFGRAIGAKLSQGQIEPGMTLDMVVAVLGEPNQDERGLTVPLSDPTLCILRYGSDATGSVIELRHGVVVWAQLGAVTFADYVYELPDISGC